MLQIEKNLYFNVSMANGFILSSNYIKMDFIKQSKHMYCTLIIIFCVWLSLFVFWLVPMLSVSLTHKQSLIDILLSSSGRQPWCTVP